MDKVKPITLWGIKIQHAHMKEPALLRAGFRTRAEAIEWYEDGALQSYRNGRIAGIVKAVKVEVEGD